MTGTEVEWFLMEVEASSIYFEPKKANIIASTEPSAKSAARCPAVLDRLNRLHTVACPFDLTLRFTGSLENPEVRMVVNKSSITFSKLRENFIIQHSSEWLNPNYPVIQIPTPYVFKSKDSCFINQVHSPELIGSSTPYRLVEGRFPINKWLRPLSWAIEWVDLQKDVKIKRGQPWFSLFFDTNVPETRCRLRRVDVTEKDKETLLKTKDVTAYVNGTKSLWR